MRVTSKTMFDLPIVKAKGEEINRLDNSEEYRKKNKRISRLAKKSEKVKPVESLQKVFSVEGGVVVKSRKFMLGEVNSKKRILGEDEITF